MAMRHEHLSHGSPHVVRPCFHHLSPPLEEVGSEVCALDALDRVRERGFGNFAGYTLLGAPVAERGTEAVRNGSDLKASTELGERVAGQHATGGGGEGQVGSVASPARLGEHFEST